MAESHIISRLRDAAERAWTRVRLLQAVWRDPRTPWHARAVAGLTIAYALSPIDLIPDFIPVVGHLDDLLIVPAGFWLAAKLVPRDIWDEHRRCLECANGGSCRETSDQQGPNG